MKYTNTIPIDASNYEKNAKTKLKIRRIYDLIPSNMKNKKKRLRANKIENKQAKLIEFRDEFDYLLSSGIALGVTAVSNPVFPLNQRAKNLLKLYMNDVGILSSLLWK